MSIRNDVSSATTASAQTAAMQQAFAMHSVNDAGASTALVPSGTMAAPGDEAALAEANTFNTNNPDHPLHRTMVVSIRASLNDLCLKKSKAVWAPTGEAMKSILQQRKFTDLAGSTESQGDLKSIVMHKMTISSQKNDFPVAVGARITGVDDKTFSATGESFSAILLPGTSTHQARTLQEDDVSLGAPPARNTIDRDAWIPFELLWFAHSLRVQP